MTLTEADFYSLAESAGVAELSNGNLELIEAPTEIHQLILLRLSIALQLFVATQKLGKVRFAPLPVRLWPGKIREPDLMFMSAAHAHRVNKYWGVPNLAVEILSEGTEYKDRQIKKSSTLRQVSANTGLSTRKQGPSRFFGIRTRAESTIG